jgi:hypothetical protein
MELIWNSLSGQEQSLCMSLPLLEEGIQLLQEAWL